MMAPLILQVLCQNTFLERFRAAELIVLFFCGAFEFAFPPVRKESVRMGRPSCVGLGDITDGPPAVKGGVGDAADEALAVEIADEELAEEGGLRFRGSGSRRFLGGA
jgi:hypothetical protein